MDVQELIKFLAVKVPYTYYPNLFPANSKDDTATVKLTGGQGADKYVNGIRNSGFQILVRSKHPRTGEKVANQIHDTLHGLTHSRLENTFIYSCMANQSTPVFIGEDENKRQIFSINFTCVNGVQPN